MASVRDIAKAEHVTGSNVSRVLRLAVLAPDIFEAILDGRHLVEPTAARAPMHEELPLNWRERRRLPGFDSG